jgi:hypothetical protein
VSAPKVAESGVAGSGLKLADGTAADGGGPAEAPEPEQGSASPALPALPDPLPDPLPEPLPVPQRAVELDLDAAFCRLLRRATLLDRAREKQAKAAHDTQRELLGVLLELYDDLSALGESVRVQSGREDVGIGAMRRKVLGRLARAGVRQMRLDGRLADPQAAEIVGSEPRTGVEPDTVVQTVSEGFWWGEEVLRPARVVVAADAWAPAPAPDASPASSGTGPEAPDVPQEERDD